MKYLTESGRNVFFLTPRFVLSCLFVSFLLTSGENLLAQGNDEEKAASTTEEKKAKVQKETQGQLGEVVVEGRSENLVGIAETASQGKVGQEEFKKRPFLRTGEILETVPGLIVTQHSGDGKANQFFFRGFNLDHGTDFRTTVDGMPVNMPTHAHGQGYTDLNFIIPELVESIEYKKGTYFAEEGDFSAAGAANMQLYETLPQGILQGTYGEYNLWRTLAANTQKLESGNLLYALELGFYNGPWELDQESRKVNGMVRYSEGDRFNGFNLTALAYSNQWDATDQIPLRAVENGTLSPFGNIDSTDGGQSQRYSLSGEWRQTKGDTTIKANAYAIYYRLNLFSNFTYFLDNPDGGDQFEQADRRGIFGGEWSYRKTGTLFERDTANTFGIQIRNDIIPEVALRKTRQRQELSTVRDDEVYEGSIGVYAKNETAWHEKVRTNVGLRGDLFEFNVNSSNDANSGNKVAGKVSPKAGVVFGPWADTELYLNAGLGFHSNDARGTTISVDPNTGDPASEVNPLVLAKGAEVGVRTAIVPSLNSSVSFWALDLSSELLFVGDAGLTEPNRGSDRMGVEFANFYKPISWLTLDADYSASRARFDGDDPAGDYIPGSIEQVLATGFSVDLPEGFFGGMRMRYFGPRPLIEDNSVRSSSTVLVNSRVGYAYNKNLRFTLDILNLFDSGDHDIDYFYQSRLPNEGADGVEDIHFHPVEPRQFRGTVTWRF